MSIGEPSGGKDCERGEVMKRGAGLSVVCLFIVFLFACSGAPKSPNDTFGPGQLQEDLGQLRNLIFDRHPMTFSDRAELEEAFDAARASLTDSLTMRQFFRIAAQAVAAVRCGHTRLSFPESVYDYHLHHSHYLPLDINVVNDTLLVRACFDGKISLPENSIILSINGHSAPDIIERIKSILPADGHAIGFKYYQMNRNFKKYYLFAVEDTTQFRIRFMSDDSGNPAEVILPAQSPQAIEEYKKAHRLINEHEPLITTDIRDDSGYAVLTIRFFEFYDRLDEFKGRMDSFFAELREKKISALILDVRGNDGGDPYSAAYLLGFLIDRPFRYYDRNSAPFYDDLKDVQDVPDAPFTGSIYVLIDGGCFSTTGHLLSLLRHHRKGILIGEETGGSYICNGGYREISLDNTGLVLLLPQTPFMTPASELKPGCGIKPDVTIANSVAATIHGIDRAMDTALDLILH